MPERCSALRLSPHQKHHACGSAYYLNEPMYYYYQRATSLSNNTKLDEADMAMAFNVLENNLKKFYPNELKEKSVTDVLYGVLLMMCKSGKSNKEIIRYINEYEKKYPCWTESRIINYLGTSKKFFLKMAHKKYISFMKIFSKLHSMAIWRIYGAF